MEELAITLPPQSSLLREYIKAAFYYGKYDQIKPTANGFIVKSEDVSDSLSESIGLAAQIVEEKSRRQEAKNKKVVEFPLGGNERKYKTIERINKFLSLKATSTILELFKAYSKYLHSKRSIAELQEALNVYDYGYPEDAERTIKLAALSVFKPEQYEFNRSYGYAGKRDQGLYLGVHSTILGMIGFVLSKVGVVSVGKEYAAVLITPEDISKDVKVLTGRKFINALEDIRKSRIPGLNPPEALVLWLGLKWSNKENALINVIAIREPRGNTPSAPYHQHTLNLQKAMQIAEEMCSVRDSNMETHYERLLREALTNDAPERQFAVNIVKKIFQVINGSERPEELTYVASRESLLGQSSPIRKLAPRIALEIHKAIKPAIELEL